MYLLKSRWDIEIYFATLKKKKQNALHFKMHPKKKKKCLHIVFLLATMV